MPPLPPPPYLKISMYLHWWEWFHRLGRTKKGEFQLAEFRLVFLGKLGKDGILFSGKTVALRQCRRVTVFRLPLHSARE